DGVTTPDSPALGDSMSAVRSALRSSTIACVAKCSTVNESSAACLRYAALAESPSLTVASRAKLATIWASRPDSGSLGRSVVLTADLYSAAPDSPPDSLGRLAR